jgi:general secretion pathway protein K
MKRDAMVSPPITPSPQRGMALIMVLWLVALLGIIASSHARNVHTETRLAARHIEVAAARALTEAGIQHAILELLVAEKVNQMPVDGTVGQINFNGSEIRIAIRDATGLVDLNTAGPALLMSLVATLNIDHETQQKIVASILDWRDGDDLSHLDGAEDSDYQAAGHAWSARDDAFSSIEELRYVMGMTQLRFNELAPFVTIYSQQSSINLEFASPYLITALTGQDVVAAEQRARPGRQPDQTKIGSGTYHIYVSTAGTDGIEASAEAVVRLSTDDNRPYHLLYWHEPMRIQFTPTEPSGI